jgi:SAM-dependent MidA family methyltransferase
MDLCLYDEEYGYYRSERVKIGKEGDFYTSSSVGTLMGEMLAAYIAEQLPELVGPAGGLTLVEFGGGTGRLSRHIMDALQAGGSAYERVRLVLIETSPHHRALQREALAAHAARTSWTSEEEWLAGGAADGVLVLANELLDAFAVHVVEADDAGRPHEVCVAWDEAAHRFAERLRPLGDDVSAYLAAETIRLLPGQRAEVNLAADAWVGRIAGRLRRGRLVVIDYGDVAAELYAPHRMRGTLLGYRRHEAAERPYEYVGRQDLTAHVNFSALIRVGRAAGCTAHELMPQREFLLRQGILAQLQDALGTDPFSPAARRNRAIRQLLLSDQMSELFKVLILSKLPQSAQK